MFIIKTAKGLLNEVNVPELTCDKECLIGATGVIDYVNKTFRFAPDANGAKAGFGVVYNRQDMPEIYDTTTYKVPVGDKLRVVDIRSLVGLQVLVSDDLLTATAGVVAGDYLAFDNGATNGGKWVKVADRATAITYSAFLRVQKRVAMGFGGKGFECIVEKGATL